MKRNHTIIFIFLLMLLCGCSGKEKYEPFTPLSKETVSPEREAAVEAALNGNIVIPENKEPAAATEVPAEAPTFDENSFFAEVVSDDNAAETIPPELSPFAAATEPVEPTKPAPTMTPVPTAVTMFATLENGMMTYTLQEGEDVVCIARRLNISLPQLLSQNKLTSPEEAGAGTVLLLPRNPNAWSNMDGYGGRRLIMHPAAYVVNSGDTIFSIACSFGDVSPDKIADRNQLILGEPLQPGIEILIP